MKNKFIKFTSLILIAIPLAACGQTTPHTHVAGKEWSTNSRQHWHVCEAGDHFIMDQADHTIGDPDITEPTCTESGLSVGTCTVCGYHVETILPPLGHEFSSEWSADKKEHWHACTREGCTEKICVEQHSYTIPSVVEYPTCYSTGKGRLYCICGSFIEVEIPANGHIYSNQYFCDETQHWKECLDCGYKHHVEDHDFALEFSSNEGYHWHECVCGCKSGIEAHEFNQKVVSEEFLAARATCNEPAKYYYSCVCGRHCPYTFYAGQALEHDTVDGVYDFDDEHHWLHCFNFGCDAKVDVEEHEFVVGCDEEYHYDSCAVCGHICNIVPHNFVNGICLDCGYVEEFDSMKDIITDGVDNELYKVVGKVVGLYETNTYQGIFIANGNYGLQIYKCNDTSLNIGDIIEVWGTRSYYKNSRSVELIVERMFKYTTLPQNGYEEPTDYVFDSTKWADLTKSEKAADNLYTNRRTTVSATVKTLPSSKFSGKSDETLVLTVNGIDVEVFFKKGCISSTVLDTYKSFKVGDHITVTGIVSSYKGKTQLVAPQAAQI